MRTAAAKRTESQRGQALLVALGALFALILGAAVLFSFASALAARGRAQRAADLAALDIGARNAVSVGTPGADTAR